MILTDARLLLYATSLNDGQTSGVLDMDAVLAALAIEHGATLYSTDRDFSRFAGLACVNPLVKST